MTRQRLVGEFVLPHEPGRVIARALQVMWPTVVVRTYVFTDGGRRTVRWRSTNGGKTWRGRLTRTTAAGTLRSGSAP